MFRKALTVTRKFSKRREVFCFTSPNHETEVEIKNQHGENIKIPLEAHEMGTYGPSLIPFNEKLLEDLACPISGCDLEFDSQRNVLISREAQVAFPINKAGMPIFLKRWALRLDELK